ncbi:hypothetical protein WME94_17305 [Sorangium sp. So ce429]
MLPCRGAELAGWSEPLPRTPGALTSKPRALTSISGVLAGRSGALVSTRWYGCEFRDRP